MGIARSFLATALYMAAEIVDPKPKITSTPMDLSVAMAFGLGFAIWAVSEKTNRAFLRLYKIEDDAKKQRIEQLDYATGEASLANRRLDILSSMCETLTSDVARLKGDAWRSERAAEQKGAGL